MNSLYLPELFEHSQNPYAHINISTTLLLGFWVSEFTGRSAAAVRFLSKKNELPAGMRAANKLGGVFWESQETPVLIQQWQTWFNFKYYSDASNKVYPNPFKDKLQIKHLDVELPQGSVQVINLQGRVIFTPVLENISKGLTQFNLSEIPDGIQLLKIKSGTETVYKRIIKN